MRKWQWNQLQRFIETLLFFLCVYSLAFIIISTRAGVKGERFVAFLAYIHYVKVYIFCRIEKWIKVPKYCIFQVVSIFWKLFEIEHEID